jgi:Tfp pilus assembly protein PilO
MEMEAPVQIKNRQQTLIILTLAVLALYIGNYVVYEPMVHWWKSRQDRITALSQEVKQGKSLIRREQAIHDQWDHMRSNSLPNDSSQAEQQVLKAFNNWAGDSGVNVNSITPQWQNDQDDYSTLDCRVEASGDLGALSRFLYEIENDPMALQLQAVELTASDDQGQQLTLGLQISGLALVSQKP